MLKLFVKKFVVFLAIFVVILFIITLANTHASFSESFIKCKQIQENIDQDNCFNQLATRSLQKYSLEELQQEIKDNPKLTDCHTFAHYVGWALITKVSFSDAFSQTSEICAYGIYHGIVENYIAQNSEVALSDQLKNNPCKELPSFEKGHCLHGLGHAVMLLTSGDLKQSFSFCEELSKEEVTNCFSGALMEFSGPKGHIISAQEKTKQLLRKNPDYPCEDLQEQNKNDCYRYRGSMNFVANTLEEAYLNCTKIESKYKVFCYHGIGLSIPSLSLDIRDISFNCKKALHIESSAYEYCIKGVLPFLSSPQQLCAIVEKEFENFCLEESNHYHQ